MDSLIFELQIVFYFQLFLSANVRHNNLPSILLEETLTCIDTVFRRPLLKTTFSQTSVRHQSVVKIS